MIYGTKKQPIALTECLFCYIKFLFHVTHKLEVAVVKVMLILRYYSSELRQSFFSLCVSIQNIERAK